MEGIRIKDFKKVLVANRGEIAIRVYRALNELGIQTIGIYSKEDKYSLFRTKADESYELDRTKGAIEAYLDIQGIIKIAKEKGADAIHPGYGFLSENSDFAQACADNGIVFIGPDKASMDAMGDKISSKKMALECNVPIIPGIDHALKDEDEAVEVARQIGYPVMLKASNGGGGRGMRIVNREADMLKEYNEARTESLKAFGSEQIFIEKYLKAPKHVEVQILGDQYGNIVHLFDRDCSVQRRHQKVVEYAPAFTIRKEVREKMFADAVRLAKHVGYKNAGTLEFLVDADQNYYFIEMNPRVQVEHTVTEMITGVDIVRSQILVAEGYPLSSSEINIKSQKGVLCNGFAIQARVTTEDPTNNFLPDTGKIAVYRSGSGNGIRLDGGTAYTGAEITPYYDSLLVKIISYDRNFKVAAKKAIRALQETRVRGVKTNIPFLINVLKNDKFTSGACTTTFIEETPSLFEIELSKDRATKIAEFIGNKMVNEVTGEKPDFTVTPEPKLFDIGSFTGARDEFIAMGAKDFTQKILGEKKLYITDTSMRDAHQSLMATRMRTIDLEKAAPLTNQVMRNAFSVEAWGGATFDVAYRFLKESPWIRLQELRKKMPNSLIQMLLRASNAVGYSSYPDNVVREFIKEAANRGVDVFRIFDSLNWMENMKMPVEEALKTGKIVEGAVCYTGDILNPDEKKYTVEYYVNKAKELEAMGCHIFAIKDMAGLLKPYAAKELFTALKSELKIPVHLHTHDSTGNGVSTILMAAEAGVDIVDAAIEAMSSLTSQPSMNSVVEALKNTERDTGLNIEELSRLSKYYADVRKVYYSFESNLKTPNTEIYRYEIPGGQYSNLVAQVKSMGGSDEDFEQIKKLYKQANELFGNIIKVTPTAKIVGDMAIFMFQNKLNKDNIFTEGKDLSYPDSVIEYFSGLVGQPDGGFPEELQKMILKDKKPLTDRAGKSLAPANFEEIKEHILKHLPAELVEKKHLISYALYPKVFDDFCKHLEWYNDVSKLESHVFFYGLKKGEETMLELGEGKNLIIKFNEMSAPNAEGVRTVSFEINGVTRDISVVDKKVEETVDKRPKVDKGNNLQVGSPIPGTIGKIQVKPGDYVEKNSLLVTVEAMKMETSILSTFAGTVKDVLVKEGDKVQPDDLLVVFESIDENEFKLHVNDLL